MNSELEKILPPRGLPKRETSKTAPLNFSWVKFTTLFLRSMWITSKNLLEFLKEVVIVWIPNFFDLRVK